MRWLEGLAAASALAASAIAFAASPVRWAWTLPTGVAPPSVPADNAMTKARVALGHRLFYDADLSINGTLSCATCHEQRHSFSDGVQAHPGAHGEPGLRNVPSLLNVAWATPLTWANPGLTTLEQQAIVPITGDDPVEMGMKGQEAELTRRLSTNACYRKLFARAFPEDHGRIDFGTVAKALAAYQRTIVSFDTAWDRAKRGGPPMMEEAKRGETLFRGTAGCASCHIGPNFTDYRLHRFVASAKDRGAIRATGSANDDSLFRTPSLRNIALTAPYLHDGSAPTMDAAIAAHGITLNVGDMAAIKVFLDQLTDRTITADTRFGLPPKSCATRY